MEMIVSASAVFGTEVSFIQPVRRSTFPRAAEYGFRRRANGSQVHGCSCCMAGILVFSVRRGIDVLFPAGAVVHALHEFV